MKQCPNPDCPIHQSGRLFNADDTICPRCASELLPIGATAVPVVAADPALGRVGAALGAVVILLLVFGLALGAAGLLSGLTPKPTPVVPAAIPDTIPAATALAIADATRTAVAAGSSLPNTPVVSLPTATSNVTPLPPSTGAGAATGPGGTINSGTAPGSGVDTSAGATSAVIPGVSAWRLCRRIAAGEPCEPVSAYGPRDAFNLAVQAGFGPGGATSARVRWYGPNGILLYATEPVVPGRTGTYWIAFTLTQSQPWAPGVYRAEIYLDETLYRQVDIVVVQ
jgi:hypothetical protein